MNFAIRIVNLYNFLNETKQERIMSKQILRSGTSVGANIREAAICRVPSRLYTQIFRCSKGMFRNPILARIAK